MGSFGEKLQREREMRGITLEEIAEATKIGTRSLRALEQEEFDKLPGGIFNKGFVRAYAKYLGIDEEQAVADFLTASGQADAPSTGPLPELPPTVKLPVQRRRPWMLLVMGLLLIAATYLGWRAYFQTRAASADGSGAAPARSKRENKTAPATAPGSQAAPSAGDAASAAAQPSSTPAGSQTTPPPAQPAAPEGGFTIDIRARRDCWVSATVDGKSQPAELLKAFAQKSLHAQKEVIITAGNVGGLDIFLNGKQLPPQGAEGQKRTLTFTAKDAR